MPEVTEVKPYGKFEIFSTLIIALISSIIISIYYYYFEYRSLLYSIILFSGLFIFTFLLLYFLYKKGLIGSLQWRKIHEEYNLLLELNYRIKDLHMKGIFIIQIVTIFILLFLFIIFILLKAYFYSLLPLSGTIILSILYFLSYYKLKINCKITSIGIIIRSSIAKSALLRWEDIISYELKEGIVYFNIKNLATKPRFPVLDQQLKIIQILNYYIQKTS